MPGQTASRYRIDSIDTFRALTMFLMIFVNDLWSLEQVPKWLLHAEANEDYLGFSDLIFPAFLFIVGLSIPLAIDARKTKGEKPGTIAIHILSRGISLLIMGLYHVNLENYNESMALLPKPVWQILITVAFFLVWLDYRHLASQNRKIVLRLAGLTMLIILAALYRGGTLADPEWMQTHWWGILGLIGWAYLFASMLYLLAGPFLKFHLVVLAMLVLYNIALHANWLGNLETWLRQFYLVGNASESILVMAGVVTTLSYQHLRFSEPGYRKFVVLVLGFSLLIFIAGLQLRPFWGISKIYATPAWIMICMAVNLAFFVGLTWLIDRKSKSALFQIIKPAGTSTLTCYLLPYIHYAFLVITGLSLPLVMRTGLTGIIKSLTYAMVIILLTGFLQKIKIRLKL